MITDEIAEEHFQKSMNLPGWRYHDLPKLKSEDFAKFIDIAGEENLRWITLAQYPAKSGGYLRRGQCMMAPEAVSRCEAYAQAIEAGTAETGTGSVHESACHE